jgi:carbamoylphosphate synthase large subunit
MKKNMIAMSQNKKLEKEILSNKGVQIPPKKIFHTLALF